MKKLHSCFCTERSWKDMKTIKDYLYELDATQLVDTFFEEYGEKLFDLYYFNTPKCDDDAHIDYDESIRDLSVYDYAQAERKQLYDFIKYLQGIDITPIPDGKTGIIYAFSKYDMDIFNRWRVRLLFKEELLADPENCPNRSFAAVKLSEVLGFLVADNKFTQDIIYKVIAFVMYTSSLTGYRQENNERFFERYKKRGGEDFEFYAPIDEMSLYFISDDPERISFNETAESQKRLNDVRKAISEYEMFTMRREREIMVKGLRGNI